jgi:hypothetical protein
MKSKVTKPEPKRRIVNMLSLEQVEAILDGVEKSAFTITMSDGDDAVATLSSAAREVFSVDLNGMTISQKRDGNYERVFTVPPKRLFSRNVEHALFTRIEAAIKVQYAIGGQEALNTNLFTRSEIIVLIDAIRAMAFKIERLMPDLYTVSFDGRQVFRIYTDDRYIKLNGLSGQPEIVYQFRDDPESWFWAGTDRKLWRSLNDALTFYETMMHKVRMADYRAMFGNQMQKVITGLAQAMEEAEADVRMLEKVDKTNSGAALHPEVARLVQKDLDAGEEQANQEANNEQ